MKRKIKKSGNFCNTGNRNMSVQKIFYNRETITELNYEIHKISFIPPFYATKMFNLFLTSRISANHEKVEGYSTSG